MKQPKCFIAHEEENLVCMQTTADPIHMYIEQQEEKQLTLECMSMTLSLQQETVRSSMKSRVSMANDLTSKIWEVNASLPGMKIVIKPKPSGAVWIR